MQKANEEKYMLRFALVLGIIFSSCIYAATHNPQELLNSIKNQKDAGKIIAFNYCILCHAENPQIQLGAPRIKHKEDWEKRLSKGKDSLFVNTDKGMNAMPARGGCFECTDKQLKQAIEYLLDNP